MLCLSIKQPWATLIMQGLKHYETRSWKTAHTGPMLIHASSTFTPAQRALLSQEPFLTLLKDLELPRGVILGKVLLDRCIPTEDLVGSRRPDNQELLLGDFTPGRWAWRLCGWEPLDTPVACKGMRGLFPVKLVNGAIVP